MRVFLTGASGLVGSNFAEAAARRGHEVAGVVGRWDGGELPGVRRLLRIDLRDAAAVAASTLSEFPDAIVNAAAVSSPALCDDDPDGSDRVNVRLPEQLAQLANHLSARFVHVSSEQVFDGTRAPYGHADPPAPLHLYARQKVESERLVHVAAPEFAVTVRAPLLMGNSPGGHRSVHERLFLDWAAGRVASLYADEIHQPCLADNLAEVLLELCERCDLLGVYHWGGAQAASRHELGLAIARYFKVPEKLVAAVRLAGTTAAANRPADLRLDLHPLVDRLKTRPEAIGEQLERLNVPPAARAWWHAL